MAISRLQFFFDYVSPYSYIAWTQVHALAARHGLEVEPVPILFAAVLGARGTLGPAEVPAKRAYAIKDLSRLARAHGLPFSPPPAHPFNPLFALRVSSLPMPSSTRLGLIDRLFAAVWGHDGSGPGITERSVVATIAAEVGISETALAGAETPEGKARVHQQTDEALAAGVFGVPSMLADGELFFGVDSLPHLAVFLSGEGAVPAELVERWAQLPAAATRKP